MADIRRVTAAAVTALARPDGQRPVCGIVLGSGLGRVADHLEDARITKGTSIEGYPRCTVQGHDGLFVTGRFANVPVVVLKGRLHAYEGHSLPVVGLPARILGALGIRALILTNAAGGLREDLHPGSVMAIRDHINLLGGSPLDGPNLDDFGPRFPDMSAVYPSTLRQRARAAGLEIGLTIAEGVYAAVRGPQYETPAEVSMLGRLGADAVGMSTVPEAIVASHMGIPVLGLSLVCNRAAGLSPTPLSHAEVLSAADSGGRDVERLLRSLLPALFGASPS